MRATCTPNPARPQCGSPASGASRPSRRRAAALLGVLAPTAALGIALAPPASAHDELVSSSPDDGARVASPRALTLTYSESLVGTGFRVVVRGPDGRVGGDVRLSGARLVQRFDTPLAPGPYDVVWRVVSADGHPISGRLSFTVRGAASASPTSSSSSSSAATSSAPTSSAPASSAPSVSPSTANAGSDGGGSGRGGLVLTVGLAAVVAAAVAAAVSRRRGRRPGA
jgi:copper resistance protein C